MNGDSSIKRVAATVGTFDGVHLGHRLVLDTLRLAAEERDLTPIAITFDAHPLSVIAPDRTPPAIMSPQRKLQELQRLGFATHVLDFTPSTARLSAADWMRNLHAYHAIDAIIIGYDNTFGHDGRSLSPDNYIRLGEEIGLEVIIAPRLEGVSSSAIRRLIAAGNIKEADAMLGQPFILDGVVEEGDRIGRKIGFPTANLRLNHAEGRLLPAFGVYAAEVMMPDGSVMNGVSNIGLRPSVSDIAATPYPRIETHIPGYNGKDFYGQPLEVRLLDFIRPEKKFDSLEDLKKQLQLDCLSLNPDYHKSI
ncbi:MAG: riboflavin biosynthesis protein RibF [Muribaculaceae bacterium]|nr:riboflavin biosynthesis protein RibF [Muribaculaceae bacterium]